MKGSHYGKEGEDFGFPEKFKVLPGVSGKPQTTRNITQSPSAIPRIDVFILFLHLSGFLTYTMRQFTETPLSNDFPIDTLKGALAAGW